LMQTCMSLSWRLLALVSQNSSISRKYADFDSVASIIISPQSNLKVA
jgi:hypothetical protein